MSRRGAILQDYGNIQMPESSTALASENARLSESRRQFNAENERLKGTAKAKEQGDATDYITGLKVDGTGINDIDAQNSAELLRVQNEMIRMGTPIEQGGEGKSTQDIQIYGMRVLPQINNTANIAKNYKAQIDKDAIDLEKTYGAGFDRDAYYNQAYKKLSDDLLERDDKGKTKGYKDPNLVPQNRNYSGEIESDPESLGTVFKTSGSFQKGLEQTTKIPLKGSGTYTDRYGKKVKIKPLGDGTIYDEPVINDDGGQTGWRLKSEAVPLGRNPDGSLIIEEVMPIEQFSVMVDTPSKRKDFDIYVKGKLDESGVNVGKLDGRAKDVLERKFAIDYLKETNAHGSSFYLDDEVKEAPAPKNITNNNINMPKSETKDGVVGNALNIIELYPNQKDGTYAMVKGRGGNKKNLADIQILLGDDIMPASEVNDDDKQYKINYEVKDGKAESITYKGIRYDRDFIARRQQALDKEPKWAGRMLYPTEQRRVGEQNISNTKPQVQSRKGIDGKTYTSTDGITWKAADGTTVTLQK